MINLKNIDFNYGKQKIIDDISLKIDKGQYICLMGDNGSGKTTLIKILAGLTFPKSGEYYLDDLKIDQLFLEKSQNSKKFHQKVGYLFQNSEVQLFNNSVWDEISYGLIQMDFDEKMIRQRTNDILKLLQIEDLKDRNPIHLSGGEKKMVAFAAMLALNPDYILLDEPFNDLTRKNSFLIASFLRKLNDSGKTIILTCHEPFHVRDDVKKLIILKNHKISYEGAMLTTQKIDSLI